MSEKRAVLRVERTRADPLLIVSTFGMSPMKEEQWKRTRHGRRKIRPCRRAIVSVSDIDGRTLGLAGHLDKPYVDRGTLVWIDYPGHGPEALFRVYKIQDLGQGAAHIFMVEEEDTDSVEEDALVSVGTDPELMADAEEQTALGRLIKRNRELGDLEDLL